MAQLTIEKVGRRHYVIGNTYPVKDKLRAAGCSWDSDRKQWYTGKADLAEKIAALEIVDVEPKTETVDLDAAVIIGRANYKGRAYYVLATWGNERGYVSKAKLCFRDGSCVFWAHADNGLELTTRYQTAKSINGLRAYAEKRRAEQAGTSPCPTCAKYCTCSQGFCAHCHDGCDRCGRER
jgi:hypothetical protein